MYVLRLINSYARCICFDATISSKHIQSLLSSIQYTCSMHVLHVSVCACMCKHILVCSGGELPYLDHCSPVVCKLLLPLWSSMFHHQYTYSSIHYWSSTGHSVYHQILVPVESPHWCILLLIGWYLTHGHS